MNAQTEKLLNITTLMLHFVRSHPDCDIDELAKNHLEACIDLDMVFLCAKEDKCFGVAGFIPIDLQETQHGISK